MRHRTRTRTRAFLAVGIAAVVVLAAVPASMAALHARSTATCVRNQLGVRSNGSQGAAGTIYGAWVFTNVSKTTCTLTGYPSLALYGTRGRPIPTTEKRDLLPGPRLVTLAPGASATFRTSYSDVPSSRRACPMSSVMQVDAPGVAQPLFIPATLGPCGGLVHVSAVRAGIHHA
ncbi:MAG: DUF4232 domain-containing protein [Planctomycetaceae bacterium]